MTALTTRDALAKALHEFYCHYQGPQEFCSGPCELNADALIASGAVVDAATLADDEALVDAAARRLHPLAWSGQWITKTGQETAKRQARRTALVALRALADALNERGEC